MPRPNVLYIDPPWQFDNVKTGGSMTSGSDHQYKKKVLSLLDLMLVAAVMREEILDKPAVVGVWATTSMKPEAMAMLAAFGVKYKTTFYWIKGYPGRQMGMGAYNRGGVEELLIGTRGRVRAFRHQRHAWIQRPILRHSQKPAIFRQLLEDGARVSNLTRRVELFARFHAPGWAATGYDTDGRDIRKVVQSWPASE